MKSKARRPGESLERRRANPPARRQRLWWCSPVGWSRITPAVLAALRAPGALKRVLGPSVLRAREGPAGRARRGESDSPRTDLLGSGSYPTIILLSMATEKVSASVDRKVLREARRLAGRRGLSAYLDAALREKLERDRRRRAILEYLDELDERDPLTEADWAEVERRLVALEHKDR
jgi:hypothetical protein